MTRGRKTPRILLVLTLAAAAAVAASGCSSTLSDAATITYHDAQGDHTQHVSREQLQRDVRQLLDNPEMRQLLSQRFAVGEKDTNTDAKLTAGWLTNLIVRKVVDAEYQSEGLKVTPELTAGVTSSLRSQETGYGAMFDKFPKSLRDSLIAASARQAAVLQACPSGRLVQHILLPTKEKADIAFAQIRAGQAFETVAQKSSTDTGSAALGGVLGCLGPGEFVPEFQTAAEQVPFNAVTQPVKTQFGYHLILVRHWDPRLAANAQIRQSLSQAAGRVLDARLKDIDVRVDPRYGSWGEVKTENGPVLSVKPPDAPAPRDQREER